MAAVNTLNFPESSSFKDPAQIPLPNDLPIQAPTKEQSDKDGNEEGGDSPRMRELAKQIDSHVVVIDVDNPTSNVAHEGPNAPKINLALTTPTSGKVSSIPPVVAQDPIL